MTGPRPLPHNQDRTDWQSCIPVLITFDELPPQHVQDQLNAVITEVVLSMSDQQRMRLHLAACCGDTRFKQALLDFVRLLQIRGGSIWDDPSLRQP